MEDKNSVRFVYVDSNGCCFRNKNCIFLLVGSQREIYTLLLDKKGNLSTSAVFRLPKHVLGWHILIALNIRTQTLETDCWVSIAVLPPDLFIKYLLSIYYVLCTARRLRI